MLIFVQTMTGKTIPIDVERDVTTVADIKKYFFKQDGILTDRQHIISWGKILANDQVFDDDMLTRNGPHLVVLKAKTPIDKLA